MRRRHWNTKRKLMGNLLPLMITCPLLVFAIRSYSPNQGFQIPVVYWLLGWLGATWLSTHFFGLFQNGWLKRQMLRQLEREQTGSRVERYFVGFALPQYQNLLDAHQDIGFLLLHKDRLEFFGETLRFEATKEQLLKVRAQLNPHSFVLLGRWVRLEWDEALSPNVWLIEPRERATLLGNLFFSRQIKKRLENWGEECEAMRS